MGITKYHLVAYVVHCLTLFQKARDADREQTQRGAK